MNKLHPSTAPRLVAGSGVRRISRLASSMYNDNGHCVSQSCRHLSMALPLVKEIGSVRREEHPTALVALVV